MYIKNPSITLNMHLFPGETMTDVSYILKKKKKKYWKAPKYHIYETDKYKNQYRIAIARAGMERKLV